LVSSYLTSRMVTGW